MQLIPALDILDGKVVRLSQGDYNKSVVYSDNPIETAISFAQHGAKHIHLVDLSGARSGEPVHAKLFGDIKKKTGLTIEAGGGIRSLKDAEMFWEAGLDPNEDLLMLGSLPIKNPDEFNLILNKYNESILLTVDVWGRSVRISGWQEDAGLLLKDFMNQMIQIGIKNFLVTQIQRDGMLSGPDVQLYEEIDQLFPNINVTVSGGLSSLEDIRNFPLLDSVRGVILGRAFYEGRITLDDLKNSSLAK